MLTATHTPNPMANKEFSEMTKGSFGSTLTARAVLAIAFLGSAAPMTAVAQDHEEIVFQCESGNSVTVWYGAAFGGDGIQIDYQGRSFELYPVRSSGDRFASEEGLSADRGLQWRMEGNDWHLSEMSMDHTDPSPTIIETCVAASEDASSEHGSDDAALPVGTWRLTALRGATLNPANEPIVTVNADGSINGNTGCNAFGGQAVLTTTGISITNSFMTRIGCEEERHTVERAFLDALEQSTAFEVDGDSLTLMGEGGEALAGFELMPPP